MADPVISAKLIVLYRFLSHNFPRSKTMWFLANSSIWHTKMLLNLTIPHPTTCLNFFLWQFPSFSSYLEQRTVRNTRGPFLVMFSLMKYQIFVPKTPNIFAIIPGPPSTIVQWVLSKMNIPNPVELKINVTGPLGSTCLNQHSHSGTLGVNLGLIDSAYLLLDQKRSP